VRRRVEAVLVGVAAVAAIVVHNALAVDTRGAQVRHVTIKSVEPDRRAFEEVRMRTRARTGALTTPRICASTPTPSRAATAEADTLSGCGRP
jgi:hypothetical protein